MQQSWFSLEWFSLENIQKFEWEKPYMLYGVLIFPFLYILRAILKPSPPNLAYISYPFELTFWQKISSYLRLIPIVFLFLGISGLWISLANPQILVTDSLKKQGVLDIVLSIDVSDSMGSTDVLPTRLGAAQKIASTFVTTTQAHRLALVAFTSDAATICPLTTNYVALQSKLKILHPNYIPGDGTALGNALGVCVNNLKKSNSPYKIVILLSDGDSNSGQIDPTTVSEIAEALSIKVYTILIGKKISSTGEREIVDETSMQRIAQITKGQYFKANDQKMLATIFREIEKLASTSIQKDNYAQKVSYYSVYLSWGIVLILMGLLTKNTMLGNILED